MCPPKPPEPVKNIVPMPAPEPEKAPEPVAISNDARDKKRAGRNSLRIDLASPSRGAGVNI